MGAEQRVWSAERRHSGKVLNKFSQSAWIISRILSNSSNLHKVRRSRQLSAYCSRPFVFPPTPRNLEFWHSVVCCHDAMSFQLLGRHSAAERILSPATRLLFHSRIFRFSFCPHFASGAFAYNFLTFSRPLFFLFHSVTFSCVFVHSFLAWIVLSLFAGRVFAVDS